MAGTFDVLIDWTNAGTMLSSVCSKSRVNRRTGSYRERKVPHLFNNAQAVRVIPLKDVGAHEREDRHDVVHELVGYEGTKLGEE